MHYYELDDVVSELEAIETFIHEIAAREDELATFGFRSIAEWPSYQKASPILRNFDARISDLLEFARAVDRTSWELIRGVIETNKLPDSLGKIYVRLRLEMERRVIPTRMLISSFQRAFTIFFGARLGQGFLSEVTIPIQDILVAIHRLVPQVKNLKNIYSRNYFIDDEIFKPSNISREFVIEHIESAVVIIQNFPISGDDKKKLLEYLEHTKLELAKTDPSWKTIVGGLVIVAALLSGMADAPQAYDNISKAIQHILGTSVERYLPRQLPALPDASGGITV